MAIWKSADGSLHDDMNGLALSLPDWPKGLSPLSTEELQAMASESAAIKARLARKVEAISLLEASDIVALRCMKAAVPFPPEWLAYCGALRSVVSSGGELELPAEKPDYPAGT